MFWTVLDSSALAIMSPPAGSQISIEPGSPEDFHVMEVKNVSSDGVNVIVFWGIASRKTWPQPFRGQTEGPVPSVPGTSVTDGGWPFAELVP